MAFGNMSMSNAEADYVFDQTFGKAGIMNEELYYDPIYQIDKRSQIGKAWKENSIKKGPSIGNSALE